MRYLVLLFCFAVLAFAGDDGQTGSFVSINSEPPQGRDDITLSIENTWDPVTKALGLDVFESASVTYVLGVNNTDDIIQAYDAYTGAALGSLTLDPGNGSAFGVAWNMDSVNDTYYVDDWDTSYLFYTDDFGTTWSTEMNPAGEDARGMDFDGTNYWTTNGTGGGLWRFNPGVGQDNLSIPEVSGQPSGVACFPYEGDTGVAVTTYSNYNIWFYVWDGSTLDYLGVAACPSTCSSSYGLAYSDNTGTLFWSYNNGGYKISEVSFDINVALEQDTWGGIKSAF